MRLSSTYVLADSRAVRRTAGLCRPEFARVMVDRIFAKYVGEEGLGTPTLSQMRARDHVIIRLKPERVHIWDDTRSALAPLRNTSAAC